jgi:four helix bundle protein
MVWQEALALARLVYAATATFPPSENYGLIAQMRRAAVSVPSNIAEGAGRNSRREFFQFLGIASGSLAELETQIEIAIQSGYLESDTPCAYLHRRVAKLLAALRNSLSHEKAIAGSRRR